MKKIALKSALFFLIPIVFFLNASIANAENIASFYDFNQTPQHALTDKIALRFFNTAQFTVIEWTLKEGAILPQHKHINEQVTRVLNGELEVTSAGNISILRDGQIMVFPTNVDHAFKALKDTIIYELQTPVREDFLKPDFIEKLSGYLARNQ